MRLPCSGTSKCVAKEAIQGAGYPRITNQQPERLNRQNRVCQLLLPGSPDWLSALQARPPWSMFQLQGQDADSFAPTAISPMSINASRLARNIEKLLLGSLWKTLVREVKLSFRTCLVSSAQS